ncbi:MAG: ATP-binding cassette domain-containing protein [Oscillospiraceae bacterium]
MLQLKHIVKTYVTGELKQDALRDVSISFRENEFVSILGQSGSGKTTLLNIVGGLDRYTSGDLLINGVSTRQYKDADWDYYRNNSIGFVFQSYNLIPHQSVLANVELALTLAGVSKKERRQRAVDVLKKVGLEEHIHKKPNQMSGGQMQRVAIARALINNPDILLADEPTGALDSETSVQIMELLKEIARDKLVIMVTHNPELAEQYSTRIVRLLDGRIVSDSDPYDAGEEPAAPKPRQKISMSFATALSLSFNNLRTKKGRTLLTAFAGSIGIIGIALILSISTGIQDYIADIQRDTLSSYPITIQQEESAITRVLNSSGEMAEGGGEPHEADAVYANERMFDLFNAAFADEDVENNLTAFKAWLDREMDSETSTTGLYESVSTLQYQYGVDINTYVQNEEGEYHSTDLTTAFFSGTEGESRPMASVMASRMGGMDLWSEILPGTDGELISDMVYEQYDLLAGAWPTAADEVVLILDERNEITDIAFYALGLMSDDEVNDIFSAVMNGEEIATSGGEKKVSYEDVLGTGFKLVLNCEYYTKSGSGVWTDVREDEASLDLVIKNGYDLKIVGILRPNPEATSTSISGTFGYTAALTDYVIDKSAESEIVKEQLLPENENYDVLTGLPFVITEEIDPTDSEKAEKIKAYFGTLTPEEKTDVYTAILSKPSEAYLEQTVEGYMQRFATRDAMIQLAANTYQFEEEAAEEYLADYSDEELRELLRTQLEKLVTEKYAEQAERQVAQMMASASGAADLFNVQGYAAAAAAFDRMIAATTDEAVLAGYYDEYMPSTVSGSTLAETLATLGSIDYDSPAAINIYAEAFEDKELIDDLIAEYNASAAEEDQIQYTDYVALLMSGVTTMINAVSYALIGFVSISLVVSSIMIGIITYISVLERTKEIGILRSVGASKKDISRVFNAETVIVGFTAGLLGIGVTVLLNIPIRLIAEHLTGISGLAVLPGGAAVILVAISVVLTMIAGLIPSRMAAKKDPVVALRTE